MCGSVHIQHTGLGVGTCERNAGLYQLLAPCALRSYPSHRSHTLSLRLLQTTWILFTCVWARKTRLLPFPPPKQHIVHSIQHTKTCTEMCARKENYAIQNLEQCWQTDGLERSSKKRDSRWKIWEKDEKVEKHTRTQL